MACTITQQQNCPLAAPNCSLWRHPARDALQEGVPAHGHCGREHKEAGRRLGMWVVLPQHVRLQQGVLSLSADSTSSSRAGRTQHVLPAQLKEVVTHTADRCSAQQVCCAAPAVALTGLQCQATLAARTTLRWPPRNTNKAAPCQDPPLFPSDSWCYVWRGAHRVLCVLQAVQSRLDALENDNADDAPDPFGLAEGDDDEFVMGDSDDDGELEWGPAATQSACGSCRACWLVR